MSERGVFAVDREFFEGEPYSRLTQREAYMWLGVYGPSPQKFTWLARRWQWAVNDVKKFVYRLANAGLIKFDGKTIAAVPFADAVPAPIDGRWVNIRSAVLSRDGHTCVYCGSKEFIACDHVLPRSRGGRDTMNNLVAACRSCNSSKRDKTPEEWRGRQ